MNLNYLEKLSNADSIASNESEVRNVMKSELEPYCDEITYDNLGSIIFKKKGNNNGPKIMICAHIDEVGFMVRSITSQGQIMIMEVGGVKELAKFMQKVRITISNGKKIHGILNATYEDGKSKELYVDIGAKTCQEVKELGIEIGDMITYTTTFEQLDIEDNICGKAFDDRLGCFVIGEVLKALKDANHNNTLYFVGTSSEEVGIRGAKTATHKINPDIILPIDVACFSDEFVRDSSNNRQISKGMMLTHFDRTLVPNKKLISFIKKVTIDIDKSIQLDMFKTGGTDGGEAHKVYDGKPVAVSCIPVRYGHCAYSIASKKDIQDTIDIFVEIIKKLDDKTYNEFVNFGEE